MITLPTNTLATNERVMNGIDEVMDYVAKQIQYAYDKGLVNENSNTVSILQTGSQYTKTTVLGQMERFFSNDIILSAIPLIKKQGYYVWHHCDYFGHHSYWVSALPNRPHPWYSMV